MSYLDRRSPAEQVAISEQISADRASAREANPALKARYEAEQRETAERQQRVKDHMAWRAQNPVEAAAQDAAQSQAYDRRLEEQQSEAEAEYDY